MEKYILDLGNPSLNMLDFTFVWFPWLKYLDLHDLPHNNTQYQSVLTNGVVKTSFSIMWIILTTLPL